MCSNADNIFWRNCGIADSDLRHGSKLFTDADKL